MSDGTISSIEFNHQSDKDIQISSESSESSLTGVVKEE